MSKWSAASLMAGYPRCAVGFDFRVWMQDQRTLPATLDNQVWLRHLVEDSLLEVNGINLFDGPLEQINAVQLPKNSIRVAFDLPAALVNTLASTFGIVRLPLSLLTVDKGWMFIGYDIVDARTQSSGFYSFDWTKAEFASICSRLDLRLNNVGLVDNESLAIKSAIFFDLIVSDHAPFGPCGIWVASKDL